MDSYDFKALSYESAAKCCKCLCDDKFVLWKHFRDDLDNFFNFMNPIASSYKTKFTISCPITDNVLEFLDLTFSFDVISKQILVDVFSRYTDSFT